METAALALSAASVAIKYDPNGRRFIPAGLQARVTNIGTINDQFNVDILDLPPGWFTRSVPGMRMRPGIDGTVEITFHPPRSPEAKAGPNPFKVRVTPQEQPDNYIEYGATLLIDPFVDTTLALVEPSLETDEAATFRLRLANGGNVALTYVLAALLPEDQPKEQALEMAFLAGGQSAATLTVTVGPGEEVTPELRVAAPPVGGVERRPGPYPFTIKATALPVAGWPDLPAPPLTAAGTLVLRPAAPVNVAASAANIDLVDLIAREGTTTVKITNPSKRLIALNVDARPPGADYELIIEPNPLVVPPGAEADVKVTIKRSPLAPPLTAPQRLAIPLSMRQTEPPADLPPELANVPKAAPGSVQFNGLPMNLEVTAQPPGLTVELEPPRRRGAVGKFKVIVRNGGTQRVRTELTAVDPDRELECIFGPQPPRWKRIFRRAKRYAAYEAEAAVYRRAGAAAQHAATIVEAPRATDMVEQGRDDDLSRWGGYSLVLDPGNRVEVPLEVRPYRLRLVGQSRLYPFSVTTAVNDQAIEGLTRPGEFEHRPLPWLLIIAVALLLLSPLFIIVPLKLGCDRGSLEFGPFCVPPPAPAVAPAALRQEGGPEGRMRVYLREGVDLRQVAEEPATDLPGQFAKLVVPSPDKEKVLYVTAKDSLLTGATLKIGTPASPPTALPPIEQARLWPARPVWCQARPGDPGKIAYVTAVAASGTNSGLQLRVVNLADQQVEHKVVLVGTTGGAGNGFEPSIFYGRQETPLLWWDSCNAIKYTGPNGKRWLVDLRGPSVSEIRTFNLPDAPAVSAQARPGGAACEAKPFAQTDPRWAMQVIGGTGGPTIGAAGCTLAAAATVFQYYGATTNPNQVLTGCDLTPTTALDWAEAAKKCAGGKVRTTTWKEDPTFADISAALQAKHPAIVGLAGGPSGSHYVIVVEGNGESGHDYRIQDPWDGSSYKRLGDYLETGTYRLKWLVRFEGDAPLCAVSAGAGAPPVKFSGIVDGGSSRGPVRVTFEVAGGSNFTASATSGQTFDKEGFHNVRVALADGTYRALSFFVDSTPPQTSGSFVQDKDKLGGVLTLTAKDSITPVAVTRYHVQLDGETEKDYTGNGESKGQIQARGVRVEVKAIGEYTALVYSIDAAGNKEAPRQIKFKVEGKPPAPQLTPPQLNLLRDKVDGVLTLTALEGVGELAWKAEADQSAKAWLTVEPPQGSLKPGAQQKLTVRIDRSKIPPGQFSGQIVVTSTTGGTESAATAEVIGEVLAPPTPTPAPTPKPADATATAAVAVVATAQAQGTRVGGTGACSPNQIPFVEPARLTITSVQQIGTMQFRDANNACIMWYATEVPDWLTIEAEQRNKQTGQIETVDVKPVKPDPPLDSRITTLEQEKSKLTIRPDWARIRAETFTEGRIVLREDDKTARRIVLNVRIGEDRRSLTIEVAR
jgi:hypothetical protein